jgi:glycosyltransferase involved in cell wall biosynthesis
MRAELERAGIRCLDMHYGKLRGPLRYPRYLWAFYRMLRREEVQALHVHHHGALIHCGIPARLAGVSRVVMTEHGLQALIERPQARRLTRFYGRFASDITVVEPAQAEYFHRELGFPLRKLHCIANGVRVNTPGAAQIARARHELGIPDDVFAYFFVGRLNAVKDLGTLLQAFAALPADVLARARLYLVGDGPERAALEARSRALGTSERVSFLGARGDVPHLLPAADAFVMSSKSEGLPMVLLEAMAAGVPCVATAVGGIPELFGSDRGLAVPAQDPAALAEGMAALARSVELRERLIEGARANLKARYGVEPIVDQYLALLGLPARTMPAHT